MFMVIKTAHHCLETNIGVTDNQTDALEYAEFLAREHAARIDVSVDKCVVPGEGYCFTTNNGADVRYTVHPTR